MNKTVTIINTKDRPTELAMLLQSLLTQTRQDFDILILDDASKIPIEQYHFLRCIITRLKQTDHKVFIKRTMYSEGVVKARQKIVDWARSMPFKWEYYLRLDDDVILEEDYYESLIDVIEDEGYDMASGITVPMAQPTPKRSTKELHGVINRIILKEDGTYLWNGDDCGIEYEEAETLPAHHFRSCALYKAKIHDKVKYYPCPLSQKHGFREEQFFSYKLQQAGYTIGADTGAITWHQMTPSGGERTNTNPANIQFNQEQLEAYTIMHKEELTKIFNSTGPQWNPTKLNLMKASNLTMKPK